MVASALLAGGIVGGVTAPSYATESAVVTAASVDNATGDIKYFKINDSQAVIRSDSFSFTVDATGVGSVMDSVGNVEQLPAETLDTNGDRVFLKYKQLDNGDLLISAVLAEHTGFRDAGKKCVSGVTGGAATGSVIGAGSGATAGYFIASVPGAITGAAVGTVVGGIGGGLTGAAQSCFD